MTQRRDAGWSAALFTVAAIFCYGQALQARDGFLHPLGIRYLAAALVCLALAVAFPSLGRRTWIWREAIVLVGGAAVVVQLAQLAGGSPAGALQRQASVFEFTTRLIVFAVLGVSMLSEKPLLGKWHGLAFAAAFVWLGKWLLVNSPNPVIDVTAWTNHALHALGRGENPWNISYPNIYHHTRWYAAGIADENWVNQGYPYPPFSLELSGVGYLFGDMRWTSIALLVVSALAFVLIGFRTGVVAAALLLTTPRILFIVEQAWTDPYVVGLMAAVCWSYFKWKRGVPFLLGLLLVSKQYAIFFAPLIGFLLDPNWTRREVMIFLVKSAGTGILVTLPFLLMGPLILFKALTVTTDPFRPGALSFLAATAAEGVPTWPIWIQMPLLLPTYLLLYLRGPRGAAGFALGGALVICVFFAFSKHAFANHHFLALGAACVALASMALDDAARRELPQLTALGG